MRNKLYLLVSMMLTATMVFAGSVQAPPITFEDDGEETVVTPTSSVPAAATSTAASTASPASSAAVQNDDEEIDLTSWINKRNEEQARQEAELRAKELREKEEQQKALEAEKERKRQEAEAAKVAKQKEKEEQKKALEAEKERKRQEDEAAKVAKQKEKEEQKKALEAEKERKRQEDEAAPVETTPVKKAPVSEQMQESESQPQESVAQTTTAATTAATQLPAQQPLPQGPIQVVVITTNEQGQVTGITTTGAGGGEYINTTGNTLPAVTTSTITATPTPPTPPVATKATEEITKEDKAPIKKNVFKRYYERNGNTSLTIISAGYSTYFLVGQAEGVSATRDFGVRHFLNFEIFEWRAKCFGMQLFNFEFGINTPKDPVAGDPGRPLFYRGGTTPDSKVEATGQTMWFAYKPAIKFYIPCASWFAFQLYGGVEVDITGAWTKITNSYYQNPNIPQQNFFFDVYAGVGFVLTGVAQLPLEIKAEYRHPFDHVGSTVCNTELVPQGIYLSAQIHLTAPIKKKAKTEK